MHMQFKSIVGTASEIDKIGTSLICNKVRNTIQICATECFDADRNGTGCPGFYTDPTVDKTCRICHVSS